MEKRTSYINPIVVESEDVEDSKEAAKSGAQQKRRSTTEYRAQPETRHSLATSNWQFPTTALSKTPRPKTEETELGNSHLILDLSVNDEDGFVDLTTEEPDLWITEGFEVQRPSSCRADSQRRPAVRVLRNRPISDPCISLDYFVYNGIKVNPKASVELHDGDFMRVVDVIQDTTTMMVTIRGWIFKRTKDMNDHLEKKVNEVCWVMHVDRDDSRNAKVQGMASRMIEDVVRRRRIVRTNRPFPDLSYREDLNGESEETIMAQRVLVCRVKYICLYETAKDRARNHPSEQLYLRLRARECDHFTQPAVDDILRDRWRGDSTSGGACKSWTSGEEDFLRLESKDRRGHRAPALYTPFGQPTSSMYQGHVAKLVTEHDLQPFGQADLGLLAGTRRCGDSSSARSFNCGITEMIDLTDEGIDDRLALRSLSLGPKPQIGRLTNTFHPHPGTTKRTNPDSTQQNTRVKAVKLEPRPSAESNLDNRTEPVLMVDARSRTAIGHRYTFGDSFCGAGGTSRGAVMAGLHVKWGFDFDLAACKSFALNFKNSTIYNLSADRVISLSEDHDLVVDIAHLSPPCQPYSPAHTTDGKDDERNQASLFAIGQLLVRAKPRVVTLEQTDGLPSRHPAFFAAVVHIFNSYSYSVRWKVVNLADFGLPQRRSRLIMIASCPGEKLPRFPKAIHSSDPQGTSLKPWTTIRQAINGIPQGWENHDPTRVRSRDLPAETGDRVARTMTTGGGGMVHPGGKRSFTHREYACLQGFPLEHKFGQQGITKQIGNAVPPCVAEILFGEIKKALLKADGLQ